MSDELIDICDEDNNIIGQMMKHRALAQNKWHRTARVFLYTCTGEVLLQLRAKNKKLYPDRWDVGAAGYVTAGENYINAVMREAQEELGINFKKEDLELLAIERCSTPWHGMQENIFAATYLANFKIGSQNIIIQKEEIQEIKFIHVDELEKELMSLPHKFTPHPKTYWSLLIESVRSRKLIS